MRLPGSRCVQVCAIFPALSENSYHLHRPWYSALPSPSEGVTHLVMPSLQGNSPATCSLCICPIWNSGTALFLHFISLALHILHCSRLVWSLPSHNCDQHKYNRGDAKQRRSGMECVVEAITANQNLRPKLGARQDPSNIPPPLRPYLRFLNHQQAYNKCQTRACERSAFNHDR